MTRGTIEQQIMALHAEKRHLVEGVLDGTDQAARLDTEELVTLLRGEDPIDPVPAAAAAPELDMVFHSPDIC